MSTLALTTASSVTTERRAAHATALTTSNIPPQELLPSPPAQPSQPVQPAEPAKPAEPAQPIPPPVIAAPVAPDPIAAAVRGVSATATTGLLVWDRTTGTTVASLNADQQFRTGSLVKLLIAIDALTAGVGQDPRQQQRMVRMLRDSNDADASALWVQRGGAELVLRTAQQLGLRGAGVPDIPGRWGNTLLTPNDLLTVYRYLLESPLQGLAVLDPMRNAPRRAADGFNQHFGIPTAFAGQPWAVKQSWGSSAKDVFVHTSGLVGNGDRYVVVLLTSHARRTPFTRAATAVTAGGTALANALAVKKGT